MKTSLLALLLLSSPAFAADVPYQAEDPAANENFRDLANRSAKHLHNNDGSGRLQDIIPAADSLYDVGADGKEFANGYFDNLTAGGIAVSSINGVAYPPIATQAQQETGTSTTTFVSPGRQQYHPSASKAWVSFAGSGTVTILSSYNISSITDHATGEYSANFTTAFSSILYACSGIASNDGSVGGYMLEGPTIGNASPSAASRTASVYRISVIRHDGNIVDADNVSLICFGDQ